MVVYFGSSWFRMLSAPLSVRSGGALFQLPFYRKLVQNTTIHDHYYTTTFSYLYLEFLLLILARPTTATIVYSKVIFSMRHPLDSHSYKGLLYLFPSISSGA